LISVIPHNERRKKGRTNSKARHHSRFQDSRLISHALGNWTDIDIWREREREGEARVSVEKCFTTCKNKKKRKKKSFQSCSLPRLLLLLDQ
jgi:hypothetical protein